MDKERFYKTVIVLLAGLVLVMGLALLLRPPSRVTLPRTAAKPARPSKALAGKIAIVIDDVGYSQANLEIVEDIKHPLTFAVLPGLNFSQSVSNELISRGFQIILHLPMEPKEKVELENNTVLTEMNEEQIKSIIEADLASVPKAKGISNHMGSLATEDAKTMDAVLNLVKNKHLFFLDSFVTADSTAEALAREKRIKFVKRDVFLDNTLNPAYIRQQLGQLKKKARQKGQAVGIGHDRKVTLEVLREEMPKIEKEGFKFVFVSDLAR